MQRFPVPQPSPTRNRFRAGLLAGFGVVFVLLCATTFFLLRPELNVRAGAPWTPPAFPTAADVAVQAPETSGAARGLRAGSRAAISADVAAVNVRRTPGYLNKPGDDVVATWPRNTVVDIVGGPQIADTLTWWQVQANGVSGWMAETRANGGLLLAPAQ